MQDPKAPRGRTKHADLSLSEIAGLLPGTGQVMAHVSHLWGTCWYAAHGGNWQLAAFYARRTRSELRSLLLTRPKYSEQLRAFEAQSLEAVMQAILAADLVAFKIAYEEAVEQANRYHVDTGYPYIRWRLPDRSPEAGVDLGPAPDESS